MSIHISLPLQISNTLAKEIEKESVYVSPHLERLEVTEDRQGVEILMSNLEKTSEVKDKAERFLDVMLKNTRDFDTKIACEHHREDEGPVCLDVQKELADRGWLYDYGGGQVALRGPALALSNTVDAHAQALYEKHFQAVPSMFPAFINIDTLARCGYFESHPNAATFIGHLTDDFDIIEEFRQSNEDVNNPQLPPKEHIHIADKCLNPAACFPCYPTLEGKVVEDEGPVFTWAGRVFRYESRNISGLDRLWEFNVRELVFVGSEQFVVDSRERAFSLIIELAKTFDVGCSIETASDPFFATVSAAKTFWQRAQEVKYEIHLEVDPIKPGETRTIAAGSLNLHGNYFGDRFDIKTQDQQPAFSACVGLGLERWVLAIFAQHGFDPKRWPEKISKEIFTS